MIERDDSPKSPVDPTNIETKLKLEHQARSGSSCFFAIAGFSALNSILLRLGTDLGFVVGLGLTQVIDVSPSSHVTLWL